MNTIVQLFSRQVIKHGDKTALRDSGRELTYSELDKFARCIAAKLILEGLKPSDPVIITASRGSGFIASMLGVLMAGGVYVPLSDHYPEERIDYISRDCGAVIRIDDAFILASEKIAPIPEAVNVSPDDIALIAYTSGSTGKPKGVIHDHESLAGMVNRYGEMLALSDDDIYGINSPFYFILAAFDIFTGLVNGVTSVIVPEALRGDPVGLADFIDAENISVVVILPRVLRYFTRKGERLRFVMTCAERLSGIAPDGYTLLNLYGMTEAGCLTSFIVDRAYDNTPIGKTNGGLFAYLLDDKGNPCDEGEICFAGHLGRGYLNLPELSAKVFAPNPFRSQDGFDTLLHSGDIGKRLPDGNILYLNRQDWMIKINGQRVEPGEIEAEIRRLDDISDAAVKDFKDSTGQTFLTAYYISDYEREEQDFKNALQKVLPSYMIPSRFMRLESFPVNANGKLDRKALPRPSFEERINKYIAPENETQKIITEAFAKILSVKQVGINDDFFSLGGDSIKVIMLQAALREKGFNISAGNIFEASTPAKLAEILKVHEESNPLSDYRGHSADSWPLTQAQMSIYLDSQSPDKQTAYNIAFGLFLPADMKPDSEKLKSAAELVLNKYPVLTAKVTLEEESPSLILSGSKIAVSVQETEIINHSDLVRRINKPFNLETGPLVRAEIFVTPEGLLLAIIIHHLVCDGTSVSILVENIANEYNGLPSHEEKMSNLTLAQYEYEHKSGHSEDMSVYREMLDKLDGETFIYPDDEPAFKANAGKSGIYKTTLFDGHEELAGMITPILAKNNLTESSLFMGAYAYLLHLLSQQKNILFFAGENGRHDPVLQNTVGMMVHNIPVCMQIESSEHSADFMRRLQNQFYNLVSHDGADFASLYNEYKIKPDYFFVYQGEMLSGVTIKGRYIPIELYDSEEAMTSLTLHVFKQNTGDYRLRFEYSAGLFSEDTVKRIAEIYIQIIAGLCRDDELRNIRLVNDGTLTEMDSFNRTEADFPVTDIVSMFREAVKKYPDNKAVIFGDEILTYREVDDISERIACYISSMNIGKGEVVSILIPRCNYMVTASLGVLKSGAAYQPLDPTYPAERLNFMMKDADCRLLIADEALLEKVSDYKGPVLLTKDIPGLKDSGKLEKNPSPEDLFILLYTSGSTGTPKGVMLEHGSIANFCYWYRNYYNLDENSRVAAYASYGFDANMMDMYPALTSGACVCIIDEEMRLDLMAMEEWFNKLNITHSFITTQVGRQFYTTANTTSLKYLSVGGEKLVPVQPLDKADKKPVLYNGYGPTECTIFSTITPVNRIYNRVPIGTPLSNYKCYVVDANMRRLPPLVPGELLISGRGVSRGYLNRPDLTQKVFIANPFSSEKDYIRAYRTGDIVRLLPDGKIDFIGRNDGQVKIRGFRVELSEIEAVIREFPGIKDATVAAFDNPAGGKFIAAYVVSHDSIDKDALRKFIGERKPPYMIPSAIMQLDKIPLNQNSKVNRKALPLPTLSSDREKKAPANDIQRQIMGIVKEALGHDDFGVDTDLYEAGLTSITSIRLSVLIGRAFNRVMKTSDLKGNSTVEKLETFMTGSKSTENPEHEILQSYPLSASQQGVFIDTIANNGTTIYNIPFLFHLGDEIDINRLHEALKKVIEAHPYLKVRLSMNEDGEIRQIRDDNAALDISILNNFEPEKLLRPFDVLKESLARFSIHDSPQGKYLFMDLHHLIADGTSIMILLEDLDRAYSGELLEGETYSAYDAALDGETAEQGEAHNQAAKFFDNIFSECGGSTDIPYDLQGGSPSAGTFSVNGTDTREEVKQFCNKLGITENVFFLGAFGIALSRETGKTKPVFTTIYNGRNDSRLARTVGMLVKTLPVMCDTALPTGEYFRTLQSQLLGMMDNDIYSFSEISSAYSIEPNTMIDFRGDSFTVNSVCGQEAEQIFLPLNAAKTPLSISIDGNKNGYRYEMEYRSDLYSNEKMKQVMYLFSKTVNELISGKNPSELSATESPITGSAWEEPFISVTERFERQAEINPNHIAVICCNEKYSFAELNNRANKIAHSLIKHGVRKENIVAVMLHRCIDVYASRQAVLKAGGAFLCISPDYPDDRVRFILEDAGVKVIITSEHIRKERSSLFESAGCSAFTVNELADNPNSDNPGLEINEHDLCYCIYTSGSTGKPKGVMIEHGNLANFVSPNPKNYETLGYTERGHVSLALAAMTFDVSIMEEFIPLTNGLTSVIATEEEIHDLSLLSNTILKNGVDIITTTPGFISVMLDVQEMQQALRQVHVYDLGAEAFIPGLCRRIHEVNPNAYIMNGYGPTEATISCTMKVITSDDDITIGLPNANVFIYVVNSNLEELPEGETGELLIAGKGIGRGYVNLPEKTSEVFVKFRGMRAYRSGDLARINEKGEIEYHGRIDNQVKLRGFRVELGEIESVIATHPDVKLAAASAIEQNWLCVYFTAARKISQEELTAFASERLTDYMIPNIFMQLDDMPLTTNSKVDRKALPEPDLSSLKNVYAAPRTPEEEKLCSLFAKLLKADKIGIDDNFFTMGGTSLTASRLAVMCMNENIPLVYADIFKYQTVRALSEALFTSTNADEHTQESYDYTKINELIAYNTSENLDNLCSEGIGDILITGASGFLGIHVLKAFLDHHDGKAYCLIRRGKLKDSESRLKAMLMYYFEEPCEELFGERIICIDGDITDKDIMSGLAAIPFRTLINCAACVKHFASDAVLEKVNVEGVLNLIELCKKTGRRLIQISTVSIAGYSVDGSPEPEHVLRENEIYFGQSLDNEYIRTKFTAERNVLEAVSQGLDAKIIRVGNLMSRASDGEFQINFVTNGFMRALRGYKALGVFPVESMDEEVEFSPIDATAEAVLKLAGTDRKYTIFHACNSHRIQMGDVIYAMKSYGFKIRVVREKYFNETLSRYAKAHEGSELVSGLIAYDSRNKQEISVIDYDNRFTTRALYRMNWKWPVTDDEYLIKTFRMLDTLNFFSDERDK